MLRKIEELRAQIAASKDEKIKSKCESELDTLLTNARTSHLACIRDEIGRIKGKAAVQSITALSGWVIVPVMQLILDDIRKIHDQKLCCILQAAIGRDLVKEFKSASMVDLLYAQLPKSIELSFENFFEEKKIETLTKESVSYFVEALTTKICNNLAVKSKIDVATLPPVFAEWVKAEVVRVCTQDIVRQADRRQTQNMFFSAFSVVGLTKDKIKKPFIALKYCIETLSVKADSVEHWGELAAWLEGLYGYHYELQRAKLQADNETFSIQDGKILMPDNKRYPAVNAADKAMYGLFNLSLYDLALLLRDVSTTLKSVLPPSQWWCEPALVSANGIFSDQSVRQISAAASAAVDLPKDDTGVANKTALSPSI